jgi:hypothetical protein
VAGDNGDSSSQWQESPDEVDPRAERERRKFIRSQVLSGSVTEELQRWCSGDALAAINDFLEADPGDPDFKGKKDKADFSKWVLEMLGGKARQQVTVDGGSMLAEILRRMDSTPLVLGPAGQDAIDVTPQESAAEKWARENE